MRQSPVSSVFSITRLFIEQCARWRLREEVVAFILEFGTPARACGATHLTVHERDLPWGLRDSSLARQARGWILILNDEDRLLTCYRRRDASRFLRQKPKRRPAGISRGHEDILRGLHFAPA
ncbi:hypothetical protein D7Y13_32330 [Corallococcus praedator]|uniref:Uncharacterized protein n=1 Tax=Corallococcus praedator TaxID=2316724 RepID=A0ABX9Q8K1_9BACT|nr:MULTISPECIES: hypothetical protein [Corallococcus]RKH05226.1 hypothetical protein D7X74_34745 [Corallococcus sp. CA047B]RKH27303.1 hypothetical protein D7X75_26755 [Corallococcus sp. CA031C]RKH95154.1 hypothetical protein D7Y13_32330 [Corallococcus praedator]